MENRIIFETINSKEGKATEKKKRFCLLLELFLNNLHSSVPQTLLVSNFSYLWFHPTSLWHISANRPLWCRIPSSPLLSPNSALQCISKDNTHRQPWTADERVISLLVNLTPLLKYILYCFGKLNVLNSFP